MERSRFGIKFNFGCSFIAYRVRVIIGNGDGYPLQQSPANIIVRLIYESTERKKTRWSFWQYVLRKTEANTRGVGEGGSNVVK